MEIFMPQNLVLQFYFLTFTRSAMREGDWNMIQSSTVMVSWSASLPAAISPPKKRRGKGGMTEASWINMAVLFT